MSNSWDPMDCSLPGSSVRGISQARILECVTISFFGGSSQPRNQTWVYYIAGRLLHCRWILYWLSYKGSSEVIQDMASLVAQTVKCLRPGFDPWVRKIPWRRKWQPTPVFMPGKSHGLSILGGYSPWGRKELDTTRWLHFTSLRKFIKWPPWPIQPWKIYLACGQHVILPYWTPISCSCGPFPILKPQVIQRSVTTSHKKGLSLPPGEPAPFLAFSWVISNKSEPPYSYFQRRLLWSSNELRYVKVQRQHTQSCSTLCNTLSPPGSVHGICLGKNTGVGCHFLLQGILPT